MLACAGFRNHPRLTHALCEQCLPDRVVHLMGTGMVEILALEVDLGAPQAVRPTFGVIDRARPANKVLKFSMEFFEKIRVIFVMRVGVTQFI